MSGYRNICRDSLKRIRSLELSQVDPAASGSAITDADRLNWLANSGGGFTHDEEGRGISTSAWGEWACQRITPAEFRSALDAAMTKQNTKDVAMLEKLSRI